MPNWCQNSMVVYGSPTEIKDFYNRLIKAKESARKENEWDLYAIYKSFGYASKFVLESDSCGYIRGNIEEIQEIENNNEEEAHFLVLYESAWSSMFEGFDWLLEKHYNTLKQVTLAEECGCDIYINTDLNGKFFSERYHLYVEDNDDYYFDNEKELCELFNKFVDENHQVSNAKECYDYLKENSYEFEIDGEPVNVSLDEYTSY